MERCGATVDVSADPNRVASADRLMLAGQGAAGAAMSALSSSGLAGVLCDAAARNVPLLGVCVGLQLLFESSEENACVCLGLIPGRVKGLRGAARLPHLGWNDVEPTCTHPLSADLPAVAYFAHSFAVHDAGAATLAETRVDDAVFASLVAFGSVAGAQFHPERSSEAGRALLRRFLAWDGR